MDLDEKLDLIQSRILKSDYWQIDVIEPLANTYNVSVSKIEELLKHNLDMSSLNSLHSTAESAAYEKLLYKIFIDLDFHLIVNALHLISKENSLKIIENIAEDFESGTDYDEALNKGKEFVLNYLLE